MQVLDIKNVAVDATKRVVAQIRDDDSSLNRSRGAVRGADEKIRHFARAQPVVSVLVAVLTGYCAGRALAKLS